MEIRKWRVVDIYYKEGEREQALKLAKHYDKIGYDPAQEDVGYDDYVGTFQCIKVFPKLEVHPVNKEASHD